jgi:hypothetical protein
LAGDLGLSCAGKAVAPASSSGARVRAWFCIRGNWGLDRAIHPLRPVSTSLQNHITALRRTRKVKHEG